MRYRPRTGERSIGEIFTSGHPAPQKLENRSLQTSDIIGASNSRTSAQYNSGLIAGIKSGSPVRKNESSVFSHLTDNYERDSLKRKDIPNIPKPRVVNNSVSY